MGGSGERLFLALLSSLLKSRLFISESRRRFSKQSATSEARVEGADDGLREEAKSRRVNGGEGGGGRGPAFGRPVNEESSPLLPWIYKI